MRKNPVNLAVLSVLKKNKRAVFLLVVVIVAVVLLSLIPPLILKSVLDDHLVVSRTEGMLKLGFFYLFIAVLIGVSDFLKGAILTVFGQKITREVRSEMMKKMERIQSLYFSSNGTGTVVSRFTNDVDAMNSLFTNGLIGILIDSLKIIGIVISMALFDPILGLIALFLLPVIFVITRIFQKSMLKAQIKNRTQIGKVNNHLTETLKNVQMIKTFGKERYMEDRFTGYLDENYMTIEKVNFYDSLFPPVIQVLRALLIALIVTLASPDLALLGITIGMVAASVDYISDLFTPIENLGMELQNMQQSISGIERINAFFAEAESPTPQATLRAETLVPDRSLIRLVFDQVSFQYEEGSEVFRNISLSVKPGEKVAFVGRTGVGKTTLFKLMIGLLQPIEGTITLNGVDVCLIPNQEKRKIFGYVEQNFHFIKGSVADQISLLDASITPDAVERALDFVGLTEVVRSFPQGLQTEVLNDTLFSQGQKQLLAIARAIVTDPPILLLDEMTANLDSVTEQRMVSVLEKAGASHTTLTISHRLSSILESDTVIVLEDGVIKTVSSPTQLLETDEWFRNRLALEKMTWR